MGSRLVGKAGPAGVSVLAGVAGLGEETVAVGVQAANKMAELVSTARMQNFVFICFSSLIESDPGWNT